MRQKVQRERLTGFVPKTSQAAKGTILDKVKNATVQDLGARTESLNKLAWVFVAIHPSEDCGPIVTSRENQKQPWQRV